MRAALLSLVFLASAASAGELEEARSELSAVQSKLNEERALYLAAKAAMERSEVIAQFYFPQLQQREAELNKKIAELQAAKAKAEKEKK